MSGIFGIFQCASSKKFRVAFGVLIHRFSVKEKESIAADESGDVRNTSDGSDTVTDVPISFDPSKTGENGDSVTLADKFDTLMKLYFEKAKEMEKGEYIKNRLSFWENEASEVRSKYPDFKLRTAVKDPVFLKLLKSGISMESAYKALNFDAILSTELAKGASIMLDRIRARGMRPAENGLISGGGVNIGMGAMSFSRKERAEIARRVEKGEKIVL